MCFSKWKVNMFKNDRFWTKKHVSLLALTGPTSSNFSSYFYIFSFKYILLTKNKPNLPRFSHFLYWVNFCWKFGVLTENSFKPPMNFLVINYYSDKCIGEYLRMSNNLKRNLGVFWHFPISFREYYCRFKAWLQHLSVKTQNVQVKIFKNCNLFYELSYN
jgi:hypothetical protein